MKKAFGCLLLCLLLLLPCGAALAAPSPTPAPSADPTSLQLMSARLELAQAQLSGNQVTAQIDDIQSLQQLQQQALAYHALALANAQADQASILSFELEEFLSSHSLSYQDSGKDLLLTPQEWDTVALVLQQYAAHLAQSAQQSTMILQDYMGQYHSYVQGANQQIDKASQSLASLSRGQTMFGGPAAGLSIAALVLGLVLGFAACLLWQKKKHS